MAKSIKRNFLYNILLNISKVIFPLITAPYVSRVLEPDGVGLFNFANTYAHYFSLFAALGIPYYGIREIAKIKDNQQEQTRFVSEIISISTIATILCTVLMLLSLLFIPMLNENYLIFLVASTVLYITPFRIDWFFSGKEEFGYITFRSLVIKTLSVVLLFLLVHDKNDLLLYVTLNAGCQVLNELWNFVKLYKLGIHPRFTLSGKRHVKPLLILFSSSIAISIYTILDTLMLGFMTNYEEVGYYNCATHISKALLPVVTSLAAVALPRVAQLKESGNWNEINVLMNKSFSIVSFLSFPIAFGVIAIAPVFTPLFFGEQYDGTIVPLQIIILTVVAIGFNNLTGIQILLGFGFDKLFLYSILSGACTNFVLNLVLIPRYGASGAAAASVIAEVLILSVMLYFVHRHTPIRFGSMGFREMILDLVVSSMFFAITYILQNAVKGWIFVILAFLTCLCFYMTSQQLLKNSSQKLIVNSLRSKLKSE
ncbi:MAG: flippase [Bacteroidaceae bacterium]|nr:flippase [Bacteroidaceae bacterium]